MDDTREILKLEKLRQAIKQTTRAVARSNELEIRFSNDPSSKDAMSDSDVIRLPQITAQTSDDTLGYIRGVADSLALQKRYHDQSTFKRYLPEGEDARTMYQILEIARIECLGSRDMRGVAKNLQHKFTQDIAGIYKANKPDSPTLKAYQASEWLRSIVLENLDASSTSETMDSFLALQSVLDNQQAYAKKMRQVLLDMGYADQLGEDPDEQHNDTIDNDTPLDEDDERQTPASDNQSADENEPAANDSDSSDTQSTEAPEDTGIEQTPLQASLARLLDSNNTEDTQTYEETDEGEINTGSQYFFSAASADYHVFTTDYDEVMPAEALCSDEELLRLRGYLDKKLEPFKGTVSKLANKLQRQLMARQNRRWKFDQEAGILDASRLARTIANPLTPLSFKIEQDTDFKDTVVTLLIDNSGSMRGRPISVAAMCADVLARTLERCEVKTEILGFTTRTWKGGQSRQDWSKTRLPEAPGRLNDIRHIIYKAADMPWRRARKNLGLMMREGLLKENIDGEALEWAYNRSSRRAEQRRILMVISDGAPVDDSTLSVNQPNYLERHLRDVIHMIETRKNVELCAIGIGHDVTRYYSKAITISDAEQLASTMTEQLAQLFQ